MMLQFRIGNPQVSFAPDGGSGGGAAPTGSGGSSGGVASTTPASAPGGGATTPPAPSSTPSGASPSATPSPSPAPAPTPATAAPAPSEGGDDFSGVFDDIGDGDEDFSSLAAPVETTPAQPQAPPQAAPPAAPQQPTGETTPPSADGTQPGAPASTATGPREASPLPTPAEPERIAEQVLANSAAIVDHLAATEFQLSPEDVQALETDASAHIPKLLSRMYVKAQVNMLQQMAKIVPAIIQRQQKVTENNAKNASKFYARWPDLNPDLHGELVNRNAVMYRRMNPNSSLEQMIEDLGPIVMIAAKVAPGSRPNGGTQQVVPPTPGARLVTQSSPFRPAGGGTGAVPPQPGSDSNPWSGLAAPIDEEE